MGVHCDSLKVDIQWNLYTKDTLRPAIFVLNRVVNY